MTAGADELLGHQSSDQSSTPTADDLLCIDEALRLLDPLALDELQLLANSHVLADPATEDCLRYE